MDFTEKFDGVRLTPDRLAVDPVPEDVMTEQSYYLLGVYHDEDRMIILLDADKVLQVRDRDAVAASGR